MDGVGRERVEQPRQGQLGAPELCRVVQNDDSQPLVAVDGHRARLAKASAILSRAKANWGV